MENYKRIKYFCSEEIGSARGSIKRIHIWPFHVHTPINTRVHTYTILTHKQKVNISQKDISITVQVEGLRVRNGTG